jgi:prepilin-type N-terminal cleavage/methylation domain-containing protein
MIAFHPHYSSKAHRGSRGGFTLVEAMVAMTIGGFILAAVLTTYIMSIKAFQSLANYWEIHSGGRLAVDYFAADMRAVSSITSLTTSNLLVVIPTAFYGTPPPSKTVSYYLSNGSLYRTDSTRAGSKLLSQNISTMTFKLYDRVGNPTALTSIAKSIQLDLKLQKNIGSKIQSEDYLSARLVMRNKP